MIPYISICSGIEAASVAWRPLGFEPIFFAETEPFPSAVLEHHYPEVPNLGDITQFKTWPTRERCQPALLVGGTPCQSFSIAGLRQGLDDPRGNLALTYLAIADRYRPRWLVWENVPGVLSSTSHDAPDPHPPTDLVGALSRGEWKSSITDEFGYQQGMVIDGYEADESHAFSCFLAGLRDIGYGFSYRIFNAQHFGLAQRRSRVFVVGYLGDWRPSFGVLFERESLQWHPAPSREARKTTAAALGEDSSNDSELKLLDVAGPLGGSSQSGGFRTTDLDNSGAFITDESGLTGAVSSKWSKGTGGPAGDECYNLIAFSSKDAGEDALEDLSPVLRAGSEDEGNANGGAPPAVIDRMRVRRLTPLECERLQGFPDGYTAIPGATDSARYKALGNSMAVPVMHWIGKRIKLMEEVLEEIQCR